MLKHALLGVLALTLVLVATEAKALITTFNSLPAGFTWLTDVTGRGIRSNTGDQYFPIDSIRTELPPAALPEPTALAVLGGGLVGIGLLRRRQSWRQLWKREITG